MLQMTDRARNLRAGYDLSRRASYTARAFWVRLRLSASGWRRYRVLGPSVAANTRDQPVFLIPRERTLVLCHLRWQDGQS